MAWIGHGRAPGPRRTGDHKIQVGPDGVWKAMGTEACENHVGPDGARFGGELGWYRNPAWANIFFRLRWGPSWERQKNVRGQVGPDRVWKAMGTETYKNHVGTDGAWKAPLKNGCRGG